MPSLFRRYRRPGSSFFYRLRLLVGVAIALIVVIALALGLLTMNLAGIRDPERFAAVPDEPISSELARKPTFVAEANGEVSLTSTPDYTVALTFDDGPDPRWTPRILDLLAEEGVRGTFFLTGTQALRHPELVREIVARGHAVGSHTYSHPVMGDIPKWQQTVEMQLTDMAFASALGEVPTLYRPPYSSTANDLSVAEFASVEAVARTGKTVVLTDRAVEDWNKKFDEDQLVSQALPARGRGAVITMHDAGGDRGKTLATLGLIISQLRSAGYRFVTIPELTDPRLIATAVDGSASVDAERSGTEPAGAVQRWQSRALYVTVTAAAFLVNSGRWAALLLLVLGLLKAVASIGYATRNIRRQHRRPANWHRRPVATADDEPAVSILVPAYNEEIGIENTIRSLAAAGAAFGRYEIIVVDDGSTDATWSVASAVEVQGLRVVRQENGGKASALNRGILEANYPFVVMVDGDTILDRDAIQLLMEGFDSPDVGAVSGSVKVGNRRGLLGIWQHLEYVQGCALERRMYDEIGGMPCVPGAIGAFRTDALRQVGGLSTETLAEDTDLTMTLQRHGWWIRNQPDARAWTEVPISIRSFARQRLRWSYGTLQATWKHRRAITSPKNRPERVLGRVVLPYTILYSVLFALLGPTVDLLVLLGLVTGRLAGSLALWALVTGVAVVLHGVALRIDREPLHTLWAVPFQQFVHRQIMYVVVIRALRDAVFGTRHGWNKLERSGLDENIVADLRVSAGSAGDQPDTIDLRDRSIAGRDDPPVTITTSPTTTGAAER